MMQILIIVFAVIAAIYDIKLRIIPNLLILFMFCTWLLIVVILFFVETDRAVALLIDAGFGLFIGTGIFAAVYLISREGLGGGDVKFIAAAGLFLGLGSTIASIFFGSLLAALTGVVLILLKKITRKDKMPLAPFLLVGIVIAVFLT
ncbi:MAG: A24 family peptidase [Oscillospiraceae bacterium]|nr:A24 family peptidase [Oscillospiraceae bacterium]